MKLLDSIKARHERWLERRKLRRIIKIEEEMLEIKTSLEFWSGTGGRSIHAPSTQDIHDMTVRWVVLNERLKRMKA